MSAATAPIDGLNPTSPVCDAGRRMREHRTMARSEAPGDAWVTTYTKTALWLHTLERMLGWETLQKSLSTFFTRYAFKHPEPRDFFAVVNEVSGTDMTWFFDQLYRYGVFVAFGLSALTYVALSRLQALAPAPAAEG